MLYKFNKNFGFTSVMIYHHRFTDKLTDVNLNVKIDIINLFRVMVVIKTCPKARLFSAFRRFGFERRQPVANLHNEENTDEKSD